MPIRSFADRRTERLWEGEIDRCIAVPLGEAAIRKLRYLARARQLEDLHVPPGNRLEALSGDRKGQHSIRVNDQWRLCLVWRDGAAYDVEFVDYH